MATNFKVWIDNADATSENPNVQTLEDFDVDSSRVEGFKAGDPVSSLKMNSILHQNSLIAVALAEAFLSNTTMGMLSSVGDVKTAFLASIALKADVTSLSATVAGLSNRVVSLEGDVDSLTANITAITSGSTIAGNAAKLGGNLPSYYQKAITSGTSNPSGGSNGDIYIKYT